MTYPKFLLTGLGFLLFTQLVPAAEPLSQRIDLLISQGVPDYKKKAAPRCSDEEFCRRVTLDLAGTLPTSEELFAFLSDPAPDKRAKLIDQLLASDGYARRMMWHFDAMLLERRPDVKVTRAAWESYLKGVFATNTHYDVFVRDLLSNDGSEPKTRAAAKFLLERELEPHLTTRDLSRLFLGRNLQCAQCHDHPTVADYTQADYYGLQAFLNRAFLFPNASTATAVIAEKAEGVVNFSSVFDKSKTQHFTNPRMLGAKPITEPSLEKGKEYQVAPAANVKPVPTYSRRALLAKAMTAPENTAFARNIVNRMWAMMMGRGLVHPLDWDQKANPASHPQLLDEMTTAFVQHQYDLKWLIREIARSETYQLSSEIPQGLSDEADDRYLHALLKPLSPEQFAYASLQAAGLIALERKALGPKGTEEQLDAKLAGQIVTFRRILGGQAGEPSDGFSATLDQTLFLKYSPTIRGMLSPRAGSLSGKLGAISNPDALADELFASVLSRRALPEERNEVSESLKQAKNRQTAINELIWALIASSEFRFNH